MCRKRNRSSIDCARQSIPLFLFHSPAQLIPHEILFSILYFCVSHFKNLFFFSSRFLVATEIFHSHLYLVNFALVNFYQAQAHIFLQNYRQKHKNKISNEFTVHAEQVFGTSFENDCGAQTKLK